VLCDSDETRTELIVLALAVLVRLIVCNCCMTRVDAILTSSVKSWQHSAY
jgi:hypothetical protein